MSDQPARLKRSTGIDLTPVHNAFAFQLQAVEAVKGLPYAGLFHEQGLGKTKIGIDLILEWLRADDVDCVIIVTKRGLVENWMGEIKAHSHLHPRVLDQNHSSNYFALNSAVPVYLTHYEVVRTEERRLALFLKTRRVAVILDEAHKIKNPDADISKALHKLAPSFVRRVIMTGTPVANRPYDLWSQIFFLDRGQALGGDFEAFKARLDLTNDLWRNDRKRARFEAEVGSVFARIAHFSVRETKSTSGIELPEKVVENVVVPLATRQRALYDEIRSELSAEVVVDGDVVDDDAEYVLKRLLRLVQVASNPGLVDESYDEPPGKLAVVRDILARVDRDGGKAIVWTTFVDNAEWLAGQLGDYAPAIVHGGLDDAERSAAVAAFKHDPRCRLLVATPGSAKEGLTLTVANHAIFYDRSFSLDDYLQAQDRIHRISQGKTCYVWNLIGAGTVDEWVDLLLAAKRLAAQLAQADIDPQEYARVADYDFGKVIKGILGSQVVS